MFEIPISTEEDLHFERFDRYLQSNVEYEYLVVPVLNGVEGRLTLILLVNLKECLSLKKNKHLILF